MCIMLQSDHTATCSAVLMFNWVVLLFRSWQKLTIALLFHLLFIVLFAINCTNQIKSNYLNSHGEEAQEKPPGL